MYDAVLSGAKMDFETYYRTVYLPLHQKLSNRICHMLGLAATFWWIIGAFCVTSYWLTAVMLVTAPLVVYPFAWFGHLVLEKNKPAAWSNPVYAKLSDLRMCWEMLTGKLKENIRGDGLRE